MDGPRHPSALYLVTLTVTVILLCHHVHRLSGDEDWAAALDEFDTGLDTQVEQPPSKEEQELAAAKAMVRPWLHAFWACAGMSHVVCVGPEWIFPPLTCLLT